MNTLTLITLALFAFGSRAHADEEQLKLNCDFTCTYYVSSSANHVSQSCGKTSDTVTDTSIRNNISLVDGIRIETVAVTSFISKNVVEFGMIYSNTTSKFGDGSVLTMLIRGGSFDLSLPVREGVTEKLPDDSIGNLLSIHAYCQAV